MKVRPIILSLVFLLAGIVFVKQNIAPDMKAYEELLRRGTALTKMGLENAPYAFQQHREGVAKDYWMNQKGQRLHLRLKSSDSDLVLEQSEIIEKMQNVICMMQEELYYLMPDGREVIRHPSGRWLLRNGDQEENGSWISAESRELKPMQVMRYMESDSATYHYRKDRFIADQARIKRFKMAGHQLPESIVELKPMMVGSAQSVELSLLGPEKKLKAHKLKATFFSSEVNL